MPMKTLASSSFLFSTCSSSNDQCLFHRITVSFTDLRPAPQVVRTLPRIYWTRLGPRSPHSARPMDLGFTPSCHGRIDQEQSATPPVSGRKRKGEGAQRRAEILETAKQLFVEEGYAATTIRRIAAKIGISSTALYVYFPDKTTSSSRSAIRRSQG